MICRHLSTLALLATLAFSPIISPAAQEPPTPPLNRLIQQLGASDFDTRERAQKQLETLPPSERDTLAKIAEEATDQEVKSRLRQQVNWMDERIATDPPPISLDVTDANYAQLADALSQATGTTIPTGGVPRDGRFTLKAAQQPFWEVLRQLARQTPVSLTGDPLRLTPGAPAHQQIIRGILVAAWEPQLNHDGTISLTVSAAIDPRVDVVDLHALQINDARDDQGHLLRLGPETAAANAGAQIKLVANAPNAPRFYRARMCSFSSDDPVGKAATFTGSVKFLLTVAHTTTEVANAGKHVNEAISLGDSKVTLHPLITSDPDAAGNRRPAISLAIVPNDAHVEAPPAPDIRISGTGGITMKGNIGGPAGTRTIIDFEGTRGAINLGSSPSADSEVTKIVVTDAQGKTVANYTLPRGQPVTSVHMLPGPVQEPLTFRFSVPTKTLETTIPFEFKNLPIQR